MTDPDAGLAIIAAIFVCDRGAIDVRPDAPPMIRGDVEMQAMVIASPAPDGRSLVETYRDPDVSASWAAEGLRAAADEFEPQ